MSLTIGELKLDDLLCQLQIQTQAQTQTITHKFNSDSSMNASWSSNILG